MTTYAIMELYGPTDPTYAVHKIEAANERDALAEFSISQGFADPRETDDEQWFYDVNGRTAMIFTNTELIAVPVSTESHIRHEPDPPELWTLVDAAGTRRGQYETQEEAEAALVDWRLEND